MINTLLREGRNTWNIVSSRLGLVRPNNKSSIFQKIHIETHSICNRQCSFCPTSKHLIKEKMSDDLFNKIVKELGELEFKGEAGLFMRNEPLLDKNLPDKIYSVKKACPRCTVYLATNGDFINIKTLTELYEAGLGYLAVHPYDGPAQVAKLDSILRQFTHKYPKVKYVAKKSDILDICRGQYVWITDKSYWNLAIKDGVDIKDIPISNRGGNLDHIQKIKRPLPLLCNRPFKQICVTASGLIPLCCNDWIGEVVAGNALTEKLDDIWFGSKLTQYRSILASYNRTIKLCSACTMEKYRLPRWMKKFYFQ